MAITIKNNTTKLRDLKNKVNALPDKEESTPIVLDQTTVSPADVLVNKTYYSADADGQPVKGTGEMSNLGPINIEVGLNGTGQDLRYGYVTGATATFSEEVNNEIDTQADLIAQIKSVLNNKMAGSGEDTDPYLKHIKNYENLQYKNFDYLFYNIGEGTNLDYQLYCNAIKEVIDNLKSESTKVSGNRIFFQNYDLHGELVFYVNTPSDFVSVFHRCINLEKITINECYINTMNCYFTNAFDSCINLKEIVFNCKVSLRGGNSMFYNCQSLENIVGSIKIGNSIVNSMFYNCQNLKNVTLTDIKINLQIGSGTSYGHLLTLDSLLNTCKECINTGSSKTLTVGSANLEKLASVYVKLTGAAEEDESNPKLPMIQCESTDEGAMSVTDYMASKNWTLA